MSVSLILVYCTHVLYDNLGATVMNIYNLHYVVTDAHSTKL